MEGLWVALPMVGCAVMMVVMMRMMGMGSDHRRSPDRSQSSDEQRVALEAEAAELRARLADKPDEVR
jgi:hypothetical protein